MILGLIPMGYFMESMSFSSTKLQIFTLHKSFGMTVFALVIIRLAWRFIASHPKPLDTHHTWEKLLSKLIHLLLYAALIIMPLSGWLMSSAGEYPVSYFWLFNFPDLVQKDEALFKLMKEVHGISAYILFASVFLHFSGAFKHFIIDRDQTLHRMLPALHIKGLSVVIILALFAIIGSSYVVSSYFLFDKVQTALAANSKAKEIKAVTDDKLQLASDNETEVTTSSVRQWGIIKDQSHIHFTASVYGSEFTGQFNEFDGVIKFDPDQLDDSYVDIKVNMLNFDSGSADRDESMKNDLWFNSESFTESRFVASEFEKTALNQYVAAGELSIKGVRQPLEFPFTLDIEELENTKSKAKALGSVVINRLDFEVGTGEWENPDNVSLDVKLDILLNTEEL